LNEVEEMPLVTPRPNASLSEKLRKGLLSKLVRAIPSHEVRLKASGWVAQILTRFGEVGTAATNDLVPNTKASCINSGAVEWRRS
jgi:hypothetical protein